MYPDWYVQVSYWTSIVIGWSFVVVVAVLLLATAFSALFLKNKQ